MDLQTEDDRRWPVSQLKTPPRSGKLPDYDRFDASFFAVHAQQANVRLSSNQPHTCMTRLKGHHSRCAALHGSKAQGPRQNLLLLNDFILCVASAVSEHLSFPLSQPFLQKTSMISDCSDRHSSQRLHLHAACQSSGSSDILNYSCGRCRKWILSCGSCWKCPMRR